MSGKTWSISLYCVVRCILYPGTTIVVASGTKGQASEVITKIVDDFMKNYSWGSENLRMEISEYSTSINNAYVRFHNGSVIKVVASNDNARHNRANIIVVDEYRMVDLNTINTVLRKFLTAPRSPGYLSNPKYKHLQERNCEIYMSSAWFTSHWSFDKLKAYCANMLDDTKKYFCCGLPYQLAIKENLLSRKQVEDEMSESDFDEFSFKIEMETLWHSDSDGSFFRYDDISKTRTLKECLYPLKIYKNYPTKFKIPELELNEHRILSVDVALLASKKHNNDASALIINRAFSTANNDYINNIVFVETHEGLTTDELGLIIMRTFYQFKCTELVLDTNGNGLGIFDYIIKPHFDPEYNVEYEPITCVNDSNMADRCKFKTAKKCVWSIKATAEFNTKSATGLRSSLQNCKTNLLISEFEAEEKIKDIKGFSKMTIEEQNLLKLSYYQTSCLINELTNLEYEIKGNNVKIREKSNMRKDRYSSLQYNIAVSNELALKLKPKQNNNKVSYSSVFKIRKPKKVRQF